MSVDQDWTPVVLKKGKSQKHRKPSNTSQEVFSQTSNKPLWKIENQVNGDTGKPIKYVSREDATFIMATRLSKKLSQKDLAVKLNIQLKDIHDIESCKAVENKQLISKIRKYLTKDESGSPQKVLAKFKQDLK